ncbi:hypothetical protein [Planococcus salinus]|uniref:hypothetical protein n=1 Tax=Planococcus salinus TaxID=1848460 RepID=UPI0018640BAA|nr:hypothetical protein [Planococcus salinus]
MNRERLNPKEIERRLDEDFMASLDMVGEGAPDYSVFEEDDALEAEKSEEIKAKDLH